MAFVTDCERPWPLGLVSNCWKVQLDAGIGLDSLIAGTVRRGLTVIELRQGSLGEYEAGPTCVPQAERLAGLARRFVDVRFNVALSLPCLSGELMRDDSLFLSGQAAAVALASGQPPHLRLVDLQTRPEQCSASSVEAAARGLVELTEAMIDVGGILSIEHSRQPWPWFESVMHAARKRLGDQSSRLKLCFDPCNLLLTERPEDLTNIVASVQPDEVSMIHVKQRRDGQVQPDVGHGELDWRQLLQVLRGNGHIGPWLFEVAPHANVWSHLDGAKAALLRTNGEAGDASPQPTHTQLPRCNTSSR